MEQKIYFVAVKYGTDDMFKPTIVEVFDSKADADSYAALMSRAKGRIYAVLEQQTEWVGDAKKA